MKYFIVSAILLMAISSQACAGFERVTIKQQAVQKIGGECVGAKSTLQLEDGKVVVIKNSGETYSLNMDEQEGDLPAYFGFAQQSGPCVVALKYAKSSVSESFSLFVFDRATDKFKESGVKLVTNPEFNNDKILSAYSDGPTAHNDVLCYSGVKKDYYLCEKRGQFSEQLERREVCSETSCADPEIVREGTTVPVEATVSVAKANFFDKTIESVFTKRKAYLVQGDKVMLSDYQRNGDGLYYKVSYMGKVKTVGWMPDSTISVKN
ncbi:hypothetical protein [Pseudomonas cichorii]|uniref:hypothetical protein n=1 Tax=Pseudomonas cichorii TaxID=36746 RepID=UPI0011C43B3E|nr:hypothetical protein [Pseudomonas cichorii]